MGSKFSMVQMTTKLSRKSRITSNSYSFQPRTDSSTSASCTGLMSKACAMDSPNSSLLGDGAARAAQCEGRTDHEGESKLIAEAECILRVVHQRRRRNFQADLAAGVLEPQAVFRDFDGPERRANHFHFVFFEDAALGK